jgi:hypothetical protein
MKNLEGFLKKNKIQVPNVKYIASDDFIDEEGNPLEWELKKITTKEYNYLRNKAMKIDAKNQDVEFNQAQFTNSICAACIVFPDLKNTELQNSYGVVGEENLLQEMLEPKQFDDLTNKVNTLLGYNQTFSDKVEEAKN